MLAGIVNRMDRAYVSEASCGEVRLIYRLTRMKRRRPATTRSPPRLPMTLNLVLKAKADARRSGARSHVPKSHNRWLAAGDCR